MMKRFDELVEHGLERTATAAERFLARFDERVCPHCGNGDGMVSRNGSRGTAQACPEHGRPATVTDITTRQSKST